MNIKKSKQGAILIYGLLASLLAVLLISYINIITTEKEFPLIGQSSKKLLDSSNKAEKAFLYVELASKNSVHQSIYDLAQTGGCKNAEKFLSNSLWNEKCEQKSRENFEDLLTTKLNSFFQKYNEIKLPENNYIYDYDDNDIIGITKNPIEIIITQNEKEIGKQLIKLSFKININGYDFSDYDKLRKKSKELIKTCKEKNFEFCVDNNRDIYNDESFDLLNNCESEDKKNFYEVVDYVERCANSEDKACICTRNNPSGTGSYKITKDGSNVVITDKNDKELKETVKNVNLLDDNYIFISDASYVHKDNEGKVIIQSFFGDNQCTPRPRTKFRFCVESKNNEYYAYDENDKTVKLRPVVYKFALDFGEQKIIRPTIEKVEVTDAIKQLFKEKRIVIASECLDAQQEVFDLANELGKLISKTEAQVIVPVGKDYCNEINDKESFKQNYISSEKSNILIVLTAGSFDKGEVVYTSNNEISETFSKFILDKLFLTKDFSEKLNPSSKTFLSITDLSTEIVFITEKLKEPNNYADAVFAGIVDYLIKAESPKIIFEYFDVRNPSGIKYGLVDLGLVWEIAKEENVNYYLLSSVIQTESSFVNINKPNDGKAHGLGQQFLPAIKDIHTDLFDRYPEIIKGVPVEEIYENILTSEDESSLKVQISATALYLKWVKNWLTKNIDPKPSTQLIIQAYHDGIGKINPDGTSIRIADGEEEAIDYYPKVAGYYDDFITGIA